MLHACRLQSLEVRASLACGSPGALPFMLFEVSSIDIVDKHTRSRMMAGIRSKDTWPEMAVRRFLHGMGLRYRLHGKDLPGTPDLVFPKYKTVIFVHGCFWHGHDCRYFKLPKTRTEFWLEKISGNKARDVRNLDALRVIGWNVIVIHECEIRDDAGWQARVLQELVGDGRNL